MQKQLLLIIAIIVISGCASNKPLTTEQKQALAPIRCADKTQCDLFWQKTQVWIAKNSRYRIQTATDVLIQTYGPMDSATAMAYTVIKEPDSNGGATLSMRASCDNWIGCDIPPVDAIMAYRKYLLP